MKRCASPGQIYAISVNRSHSFPCRDKGDFPANYAQNSTPSTHGIMLKNTRDWIVSRRR